MTTSFEQNSGLNLTLAQKVISEAVAKGVSDFCVCAGARNSPFVFLLNQSSGLQVYNFFEERSAAFFAVGRASRDSRPVAVITTSGTAVAELLPAVIEAYYSGIPLLLITADRPRSFRGSGAPQVIEQVGIFSNYADFAGDISPDDQNTDWQSFRNWKLNKPAHLNICFGEPLIDGKVPNVKFPSAPNPATPDNPCQLPTEKPHLQHPMAIVSGLPPARREQVTKLLLSWQIPIYGEATSGLRGDSRLQNLLLQGGEKSVQKSFQSGLAKSIIRIGGIPTLRFWRDLEDKFAELPVANISDLPFSGLSRSVQADLNFEMAEALAVPKWETEAQVQLQKLDKLTAQNLSESLLKYPKSEVGVLAKLSLSLAEKNLYLGNSLPIREWDLVAPGNLKLLNVGANRGANGIDGQLSTFFGWAQADQENWAIVGDLTALYDLASLWIDRHLQPARYRIVVINNQGGQIFKNMFQHESFLNRHHIHFKAWAEMWGWEYRRWEDIPQDKEIQNLPDRCIIEIIPDERQSDSFWQEYKKP